MVLSVAQHERFERHLSLLVPLLDDDFVIFDMIDCGRLIAVIG